MESVIWWLKWWLICRPMVNLYLIRWQPRNLVGAVWCVSRPNFTGD